LHLCISSVSKSKSKILRTKETQMNWKETKISKLGWHIQQHSWFFWEAKEMFSKSQSRKATEQSRANTFGTYNYKLDTLWFFRTTFGRKVNRKFQIWSLDWVEATNWHKNSRGSPRIRRLLCLLALNFLKIKRKSPVPKASTWSTSAHLAQNSETKVRKPQPQATNPRYRKDLEAQGEDSRKTRLANRIKLLSTQEPPKQI
jgi:hypothetical protein